MVGLTLWTGEVCYSRAPGFAIYGAFGSRRLIKVTPIQITETRQLSKLSLNIYKVQSSTSRYKCYALSFPMCSHMCIGTDGHSCVCMCVHVCACMCMSVHVLG